MMTEPGPVLLVGLDGATFDILNPMIKAGKLPIIAGLIKDGASGVLESSVVPFTPQAWASVMTGNNPGKHGVFGFVNQRPAMLPEFLSLRSIKGDRLWTWFSRAGKKSLVLNVPLTYPPEPLDGVMVAGMMTPSLESEFTYPLKLKQRILSRYPDYRLDVENATSRSRNTDVLDELDTATDAHVQLALELIRENKPDFVFFVFILPDRIQHMFGKAIHPESSLYHGRSVADLRARIWESYAKMDKLIGRLIAQAPGNSNTILVSDHGFTVEQGSLYSNDFLAGLGLLTLKPAFGHNLARSLVRRFNVMGVKRFISKQRLSRTVSFTKAAIDWSKTKAYAAPPAESGICINLAGRGPEGIVPTDEYESLRDLLIAALDALRHPQTGAQVVKGLRREEVFFGPHIESIPDIVLDFGDSGFETKDAILGGPSLTLAHGGMRAIHHREGIFIAAGPRVKPGRLEALQLQDLAPNILALAGLKVPADLDGRVSPDIFKFADIKIEDRCL